MVKADEERGRRREEPSKTSALSLTGKERGARAKTASRYLEIGNDAAASKANK